MARYFGVLMLLASTLPALADGGRLQMQKSAGPFVVTIFTTPDPLREGQADFSVAVERQNGQGLVQDADVTLVLTSGVGADNRLVLHPSHAEATSRFLQAANFTMPHAGLWRLTVQVQQGNDAGQCSGDIEVLPAYLITSQIAWGVAVVPFLILLFCVHQWRKRIYNQLRRQEHVQTF